MIFEKFAQVNLTSAANMRRKPGSAVPDQELAGVAQEGMKSAINSRSHCGIGDTRDMFEAMALICKESGHRSKKDRPGTHELYWFSRRPPLGTNGGVSCRPKTAA
jgi:hypothetical protein